MRPRIHTPRAKRTAPATVAFAIGALLALAAPAAASEMATVRPDTDVASNWHHVNAPSAAAAIDDPVTRGAKVGRRDYIAALARGRRQAQVQLEPQAMRGNRVSKARLWFYGNTRAKSRLNVVIRANGELLGAKALDPRRGARWRSLLFRVPDPAALEALLVQFQASPGAGAAIRAAYAEIHFTGTPDQRPTDPPPPPDEPPTGNPVVKAFSGGETIRPSSPLPGGGANTARLLAARNEFESFQLAIEAGAEPLKDVRVELTEPLKGPGSATIPSSNVTVNREAFYRVDSAAGKPRSNRQGSDGLWPDALIPERDALYGEDRSAFPADAPQGDRITAWLDVFVPRDATPGTYHGSVRVSASNRPGTVVPVEVRVFDFQLPSTSSLPSMFMMTPPGHQPCRAHFNTSWCNGNDTRSWELAYLYTRTALENRITIANAGPGAYEDAPVPSRFAQYLAPMVTGTDSGVAGTIPPRLTGARMTALATLWPCINNDDCLPDWKRLADEYGFGDRFIAKICDEPRATVAPLTFDDWKDCGRNAATARGHWPDVRTLATSSASAATTAQGRGDINVRRDIDILTPIIQDLAPRGNNQRPAHNAFLNLNGAGQGNNELWSYTSCTSYSCNEAESAAFEGWPGYSIDQPASQARAMGWMAFAYDLDGELYWNTVSSLGTAWTNQYAFGANGDGNLFYPGSPEGYGGAPAIGGTHDIPIESMRLKRIRDGREDYELMAALAAKGQTGAAMRVVEGLFGNSDMAASSTEVPASRLAAARCELAGLLDSSVTGC